MFLWQVAVFCSVFIGHNFAQKYSVTTVNGKPVLTGALIFEDNFDRLDTSVWKHERTMSGGGNWEFQLYENHRSNSYAKNGILHIKPTLTEDRYGPGFVTNGTLELNGGGPSECTDSSFYGCVRVGAHGAINPIVSARISTINSFSFKYGRVEVRAKMPLGDWLWPAIWMLPRHNAYGGWPVSGEIDLVEARGNSRLTLSKVNIGVQQVASTLHWGPSPQDNRFSKTHWTRNSSPGYHTNFHLFQLEWTPDYMKLGVDNVPLATFNPPNGGFWDLGTFPSNVENPWRFGSKMAPFDEEFYLIINLAVGGTNGYFPLNAKNEGGQSQPWTSASTNALLDFWKGKSGWYPTWNSGNDTSALQVDYVKIWAL